MSYSVGNKAIYNAEVLKFNFCDYNDAYILKGDDITVVITHSAQVAFKNCVPFTKYITKIDGTIQMMRKT